MKSRGFRFIHVLAGIALLVAIVYVAAGVPGMASPGDPDPPPEPDRGGGNVSHRTISTLSSVDARPWTRERMQAANPYPLESTDQEIDFSLQLEGLQSTPGFIPGSPPSAGTFSNAQEEDPQFQASSNGYSYPAPFAQYQNFDSYQVYPYSTVGVLFFTQYGVDYRCSAASIGNRAIWTAGHCIHKGDNSQYGWSYNVVFVPAYKNGSYPFGVWSASYLTTKGLWFEYGDLRYDMAGAVLNDWNNQTISDVVGSLGFAYNQGSGLHWMNIGYPSSAPFDGKTQQICAGSFAYADTSVPAPNPVAMGCDMTQGSSGGPWILSFSGQFGQTNFVNGNNSYRYSYHPKELFSPYFGNSAKTLYDELITG